MPLSVRSLGIAETVTGSAGEAAFAEIRGRVPPFQSSRANGPAGRDRDPFMEEGEERMSHSSRRLLLVSVLAGCLSIGLLAPVASDANVTNSDLLQMDQRILDRQQRILDKL